ncbi:MAG: DNA-protecting protein DprA [Planctomycetes bacterium]|nr:DNA-protecting protein DprA [Planctomycetota bacterium]
MKPPLHLTPGQSGWPAELNEIHQPPEELWLRGRAEILARLPRVAIVGTRSPSAYGELQAARLATSMALHGVSVVSGLARGIDEIAHRSALDAGGATVAVLGSGVDRPWPEGELASRMEQEGCLLSEFPPGQAPRRHHFPWRNRLIAGLASAVVVVEAAYASGSLITARWAVDQGRAVFAIPGRVDHPMSQGCHRLLREGAELLESPSDLLASLGFESAAPREQPRPSHPLLEALRGETLDADELARRLGKGTAETLVALVELELTGAIARGPGGLYRLSVRR